MALSSEDAARLASLRAARDKLISGAHVAEVQSGGRSIKKGPADLPRLDGEIAALEAAAVAGEGVVRRRGALRFSVR